MTHAPPPAHGQALVIGAGLGGLASAMRLGAKGWRVTVVDRLDRAGGRGSSITDQGHRFDLGPTIVTVPQMLRDLWAATGRDFDRDVDLRPLDPFYTIRFQDGRQFTMRPGTAAMRAEVARLSPQDLPGYDRFLREAEARYHFGFQDLGRRPMHRLIDLIKVLPKFAMMRADRSIHAHAAARPALWPAVWPGLSLTRLLQRRFRDPRLVQLFARYATYVGGRPDASPAVLALIWRAEAAGVWAVQGGMHRLAVALAALAGRLGVVQRYGTRARRIIRQGGRVTGVQLDSGETLACTACVHAGDPAALTAGLVGEGLHGALPAAATRPHSLSAWVWSFAATAEGPLARDLIHHNVLFPSDTAQEFGPISDRAMPETPTLYLCAEDRAGAQRPDGPERFEIILNAPAGRPDQPEDFARCQARTFQTLRRRGLWFTPDPGPEALTTPAMLDRLFPGSGGAIYGRSPEGTFAAFQRPPARTRVPGLYLAGAGTHPGAGVPGVIGTAEILDQLIPAPQVRAETPVHPGTLPLAAE